MVIKNRGEQKNPRKTRELGRCDNLTELKKTGRPKLWGLAWD